MAMIKALIILFLFNNFSCFYCMTVTVFNVETFGAIGDGATDDSKAFQVAWSNVCSSSIPAILMVSNKTYRLKPIIFSGPCKSSIAIMIKGTLLASPNRDDYSNNLRIWLVFTYVNNLLITGGTFDGNGNFWWQKSCKIDTNQHCTDSPTILIFNNCKDLNMNNMQIINSPATHLTFDRSANINASSLTISSPSWSPNTDGIHITGVSNINLTSSSIKTGDDCISMLDGTHNVRISDIKCGPGHGISIVSLGAQGSTAHVSDIIVDKVNFDTTENGVRIKTWQGGNGYVKNVLFQNIKMNNVRNPIVIDQFYCDSPASCAQQKSAVAIINVHFFNIVGTSGYEIAIKFNCSAVIPCQGLQLRNVNLKGMNGIATRSACQNAKWSEIGHVFPPPCSSSAKK